MRTCGNCGTTQGPFDALWIGDRKTGTRIFTCHIPTGKGVTPEKQKEAAMACHNRRAKVESQEQKPVPVAQIEEIADGDNSEAVAESQD